MSTNEQATVLDRLVNAVPRFYRVEMSRFARRLKDVESKLDDVLRRLGSRPG